MLEHTAAHYFEHLDFNATARGYGKRALRERAAAPPVLLAASDDFVDMIVSGISREEWLAGCRQVYALVASKKQMKKGDL